MTKELLEQEFKNGLWHKDIAEKYGVTPRTIYEYVKKWNLHIPRKNASQKVSSTQKCKRCGKLFYKEDYINEVCDSCINNVWCVINIFEDGSKELSSIHHTQEDANLHIFESKDLIESINKDSKWCFNSILL